MTYSTLMVHLDVGSMAHALSLTWDAWKNLTESVTSGRPAESVNVAEQGKEFFPKLVASIFPGNFAASTVVVSRLPEKERRKIHKILDVAAGSGAWSAGASLSLLACWPLSRR